MFDVEKKPRETTARSKKAAMTDGGLLINSIFARRRNESFNQYAFMRIPNRFDTVSHEPEIIGQTDAFAVDFQCISRDEDSEIWTLSLQADQPSVPPTLCIRWRVPNIGIKGEWNPNALYEKRLKADWELPSVQSRISVGAPVICLFGYDDENVLSFAVSDVINSVEMEAPVQEEDNHIYCLVRLFSEPMPATTQYQTQLRIDRSHRHFSAALRDVSDWWAGFDHLEPLPVPDASTLPVYSTWYAFHQNFTTEELLAEARQAYPLGYRAMIVDDGWQTTDGGRGYYFTGDWRPDRIPDSKAFAEQLRAAGLLCLYWYSVPFCGTKSEAYQQFSGKFLTEKHPWAPVFDPRYPDVREHLIGRYVEAIEQWGLDGLKLDFIDDFKTYPETDLTLANGRDYASVDAAVYRLLDDVRTRLLAVRPDVLIEFRQKYIGPAMRRFGNLFRAFDCPSDSVGNRMRTTDVRLLAGNSRTHSDMLTWHSDEPVEVAAMQMTSILFSVPQLSVRLSEQSEAHLAMIQFYTNYYTEYKAVLLDGRFTPHAPLANYPLLVAETNQTAIFGVYDDRLVPVADSYNELHFINGKMSEQIVFELEDDAGDFAVHIFDCTGETDYEDQHHFETGIHALEVPAGGLIKLRRTAPV